MTLKDKAIRCVCGADDLNRRALYHTEDVAKFIKDLKEEIGKRFISNRNIIQKGLIEEIDKLSGFNDNSCANPKDGCDKEPEDVVENPLIKQEVSGSDNPKGCLICRKKTGSKDKDVCDKCYNSKECKNVLHMSSRHIGNGKFVCLECQGDKKC